MTTSKEVTKYRDEILKLADVTLHFTFCDRKSEKFYIVPTQFLINNLEDRDLWHGCPSLVTERIQIPLKDYMQQINQYDSQ